MNTEEVVAMMNAITEGAQWSRTIEGEAESDSLRFAVEADRVLLGTLDYDYVCEIQNPRTAREIAGALVAWANRKDGQLGALPNTDVDQTSSAGSRATWYRRSVGIMSQEAKNRNLKDLTAIQAQMHPNDVEQVDIAAAIQILVDNGATTNNV